VLGWLRYEAAPAFDAALAVHAGDGCPWPGLRRTIAPLPWPTQRQRQTMRASTGTQPERAAFDAALAHIQDGIARGDLYQVNHTAPLRGRWSGTRRPCLPRCSAPSRRLRGRSTAGAGQVLSVSPELFFDWQTGAGAAPSSPAP
jgi:para-aminobenzoate synthetase/4-amino-4-deoxychorismate lyase